MPALSPTMTEGNIATWKIKEGDSFSAGDVLLEIETDKASMDVEAQDDGVLMKIFQGDGAKSIQVGSRIGVLAEPGDDISSLEIPADENPAKQQAPKEESSSQSAGQAEQKPAASSQPQQKQPRKSGEKAAPQKYPYYPSVAHLLKENGLDEAAVSDMNPTGPQGRLLKGDVLAYLGRVTANRPEEIMARFEHNAHLDLSNIKIRPAPAPKAAEKAAAPPVPEDVRVSLPVSLSAVLEIQAKVQETLGSFLPLSTFVSRATELANDALPLPANYKPSADELFNQVLGLDTAGRGSRGAYVPQVAALPPSGFTGVAPKKASSRKADIIDILAPAKPKKAAANAAPALQPGVSATGPNVFSLTVAPAEEKRAREFLQRLKLVLESDPGRLVL